MDEVKEIDWITISIKIIISINKFKSSSLISKLDKFIIIFLSSNYITLFNSEWACVLNKLIHNFCYIILKHIIRLKYTVIVYIINWFYLYICFRISNLMCWSDHKNHPNEHTKLYSLAIDNTLTLGIFLAHMDIRFCSCINARIYRERSLERMCF